MKAKTIQLNNNINKGTQVYALTKDRVVLSIWNNISEANNERDRLKHLGETDIHLSHRNINETHVPYGMREGMRYRISQTYRETQARETQARETQARETQARETQARETLIATETQDMAQLAQSRQEARQVIRQEARQEARQVTRQEAIAEYNRAQRQLAQQYSVQLRSELNNNER